MMKYEVNVRAIVSGEKTFLEGYEFPEAWTVYDNSSACDESAVIRLDTLVSVEASNESEAIQLAKDDAPGLGLKDSDRYEVELWVDGDLDVALAS